MESPENDGAVFRPFHKPWKSIKPIPTFPPPRLRRDIYENIQERRRLKLPALKSPVMLILGLERTKVDSFPYRLIWLEESLSGGWLRRRLRRVDRLSLPTTLIGQWIQRCSLAVIFCVDGLAPGVNIRVALFKRFLASLAAHTQTCIVHIKMELWGWRSENPATVPAQTGDQAEMFHSSRFILSEVQQNR